MGQVPKKLHTMNAKIRNIASDLDKENSLYSSKWKLAVILIVNIIQCNSIYKFSFFPADSNNLMILYLDNFIFVYLFLISLNIYIYILCPEMPCIQNEVK